MEEFKDGLSAVQANDIEVLLKNWDFLLKKYEKFLLVNVEKKKLKL